MKRILAMLCVIACLFALAVPAMAANEYVIHVDVPDEWATAYVWAWDANQKNAFDSWPGQQLTKGADGYYTGNVPSGYTNLVIAEKDGGAQTIDITNVEPKELWIVLGNKNGEGKHEYSIGYSKDSIAPPASDNGGNNNNNGGTVSNPVDLAGLSSLALVGGGIPGLKDWTPGDPAGNMTKVSNGVYTKVIAVTAGASMEIKAAGNGEWNDAYNFGPAVNGTAIVLGTKMEMVNGAGAQNFALTASKDCNLKFTVDLTGATPTLLVEETDEEASTTPSTPGTDVPSGETYTVYAQVPADWNTPCVWCWDGNSSNPSNQGDWPGTFFMTKGADGWYSVEIPVGYNNVLINANGGAVQTPDITGLESGKDVWINALTDVTNPVVAYEVITDITLPSETEPVTIPPRPTTPIVQDGDDQTASGSSDNTVLFSIIGSVVVIAIAAVVYIVLKKKQA